MSDWEKYLDERCAIFLASTRPTALTFVTNGLEKYKLSDPRAAEIIALNLREWDHVRRVLLRRCQNCNYVVSTDSERSFEVPGLGAVCGLCHDMYTALTFNVKMRNMNYFKALHERWVKDKNDDGRSGGWRDRAGM